MPGRAVRIASLTLNHYMAWLSVLAVAPALTMIMFTFRRARRLTSPDLRMQAVRARILLRARVSGGAFCIGWFLLVFSLVSYMVDVIISPHPANGDGTQLVAFPFGLFFILLTLMPTDHLAIIATCVVCGALSCAFAAALLHIAATGVPIAPHSGMVKLYCGGAAMNILNPLIVLGPALRCGTASRARLRRLWLFVRAAFIISAAFCSLEAYREMRANVHYLADAMIAGSSLCAAVLTASRVRARIFRALANLGTSGNTELQRAAIIAYMVGGSEAVKAFAQAERLFFVIPLSLVDTSDIVDEIEVVAHSCGHGSLSAAVPVLGAAPDKRRPGVLGECDLFVSHSHSDRDHVDAKLAALHQLDRQLPGDNKSVWIDTAW